MSVRKLPGKGADGRARWLGRVFRGYDGNGRRLEHSKVWPTERECAAWVAEELRKIGKGEWLAPSAETLGQYLQRWMAERLPNRNVRERTAESYRWLAHGYLLPDPIASMRLDRVNTAAIQGFIDRLAQQRSRRGKGPQPGEADCRPFLSARTVRYGLRVLLLALKDARRAGLIGPTQVISGDLQVRSTGRRAARWLQRDEFLTLIERNQSDPLVGLWGLLGYAGLRPGEALGMMWEQVDLADATVRVEHSLTPSTEAPGWVLTEPKTEKSKAAVPLLPAAVALLEAHRSRQEIAKVVAGSRWVDHGFVFCGPTGEPLRTDGLVRKLAAACKRAGVLVVPPYALRHSCASLLHAAGVSPKDMAEWLRHTDPRLTLSVYTHTSAAQLRDAADKLGAYMAAKPAERES